MLPPWNYCVTNLITVHCFNLRGNITSYVVEVQLWNGDIKSTSKLETCKLGEDR